MSDECPTPEEAPVMAASDVWAPNGPRRFDISRDGQVDVLDPNLEASDLKARPVEPLQSAAGGLDSKPTHQEKDIVSTLFETRVSYFDDQAGQLTSILC